MDLSRPSLDRNLRIPIIPHRNKLRQLGGFTLSDLLH